MMIDFGCALYFDFVPGAGGGCGAEFVVEVVELEFAGVAVPSGGEV
jgi:hypothetical protein